MNRSKFDLIISGKNHGWIKNTISSSMSGNPNLWINSNVQYQKWDGFGGTFNEAGWDALSILSEYDRIRAIKLLFDSVEGARFIYGRIPIGASDFALNRYTLNETENDYRMENFSIARDKERLIPYIRAAKKIRRDPAQ